MPGAGRRRPLAGAAVLLIAVGSAGAWWALRRDPGPALVPASAAGRAAGASRLDLSIRPGSSRVELRLTAPAPARAVLKVEGTDGARRERTIELEEASPGAEVRFEGLTPETVHRWRLERPDGGPVQEGSFRTESADQALRSALESLDRIEPYRLLGELTREARALWVDSDRAPPPDRLEDLRTSWRNRMRMLLGASHMAGKAKDFAGVRERLGDASLEPWRRLQESGWDLWELEQRLDQVGVAVPAISGDLVRGAYGIVAGDTPLTGGVALLFRSGEGPGPDPAAAEEAVARGARIVRPAANQLFELETDPREVGPVRLADWGTGFHMHREPSPLGEDPGGRWIRIEARFFRIAAGSGFRVLVSPGLDEARGRWRQIAFLPSTGLEPHRVVHQVPAGLLAGPAGRHLRIELGLDRFWFLDPGKSRPRGGYLTMMHLAPAADDRGGPPPAGGPEPP